MKGQTLREFIDDMLIEGGFEKEFLYKGKEWFIGRVYNEEHDNYSLYILDDQPGCHTVFEVVGNTFQDLFEKFEKAKIFDGRTIYEAEKDIEITTTFS